MDLSLVVKKLNDICNKYTEEEILNGNISFLDVVKDIENAIANIDKKETIE